MTTYTYLQTVTAAGNSLTITPHSAGNLIVVCASGNADTAMAATNTPSSVTWNVPRARVFDAAWYGWSHQQLWAVTSSTTATTITVTGPGIFSMIALEFDTGGGTVAVDATNSSTANHDGVTLATTVPTSNDLCVSSGFTGAVWTPISGFTGSWAYNGIYTYYEYDVDTGASGSLSSGWTSAGSDYYGAEVTYFKLTGGIGGGGGTFQGAWAKNGNRILTRGRL